MRGCEADCCISGLTVFGDRGAFAKVVLDGPVQSSSRERFLPVPSLRQSTSAARVFHRCRISDTALPRCRRRADI
jgi:hypothetical protein